METLTEGGVAVLRNGGVACRSTITFHSGSLRDGIHYMAARETETDDRKKQKDIEMGRQGQEKKKTEERKRSTRQ